LKIKQAILNLLKKPIDILISIADVVKPPGFEGASIYEIMVLFFKSLGRPQFGLYAGALSFNFFLAMFPAIIFLFTIIAYIPIPRMHDTLLETLDFFLPESSFSTLSDSIKDIIQNQRGGMLSIGFIATIYFASNGFFNMMTAFDTSMDSIVRKRRNYFKKRLISVGLTMVVSLLIICSVVLLIISGYISGKIGEWGFNIVALNFIIKLTEIITLTALVFFTISFIYRFGPASIKKWKFFSPGSKVATILSLLATYGFTTYVNQFNLYNKVYGSIGAIIALMLLIYVNVYSVLVGFELNHSINKVSLHKLRMARKENTFKL
jgi:membrane protein